MDRKRAIGPSSTDQCPRCGECKETAMHRWWECPVLDDIRRETGVQETVKEWERSKGGLAGCLKECGLVPSGMVEETASEQMKKEEQPKERNFKHDVRRAWTDGSAANSSQPGA